MIITSVIYPFHTIFGKCDPMKVTITPEGSSWKLLVICGPVQFWCNACNLGHTERYNSLSYCCLTLHNISAPLMNLMVWWPWNISPSMPPFLLPHTQKGNRKNKTKKQQQTNWWIHCICLIYSTADCHDILTSPVVHQHLPKEENENCRSMNQHTRELFSAQNTYHRYNKDLRCLW